MSLQWIKEKYLCNFDCILCHKNIEQWGTQKDEPLSAAGTQVEELLERHRHRIKNNRAPTAADSHPIANMAPPTKKWMKGEAILSI